MRTPSHAGRHPPEGRTHPRRQVFSHNGVPDGKALYRQVAALKDGLDVFITSWKNPDESMREVSFDDYIRDGVDAIVRVARDFSGADKVHAAGAQTFHTMHHVAADKRFVLSSSGHILGIVNPPVRPAKRRYWVGSAHRTDKAAQWRERAEAHAGSWWDDWMAWLKPRAGELVAARPASDERHPALCAAPGAYVREA